MFQETRPMTNGVDGTFFIELEPAEEEVIYRVETSLNGTFDDAVVTYQLAYQNKVSLGRDYCDGNHTSEELRTLHNVRITAIDLAGNESQSTDVGIELEPDHGEPEVEEGSGKDAQVQVQLECPTCFRYYWLICHPAGRRRRS